MTLGVDASSQMGASDRSRIVETSKYLCDL